MYWLAPWKSCSSGAQRIDVQRVPHRGGQVPGLSRLVKRRDREWEEKKERIGISSHSYTDQKDAIKKVNNAAAIYTTSCLQRPAKAWRWCWARGGSRWRNQRWQRSLRACTSSSLPLVHAKDIGNLYHSTCASAKYLYIKSFKENLYIMMTIPTWNVLPSLWLIIWLYQ